MGKKYKTRTFGNMKDNQKIMKDNKKKLNGNTLAFSSSSTSLLLPPQHPVHILPLFFLYTDHAY
jgi:hypothetical protein